MKVTIQSKAGYKTRSGKKFACGDVADLDAHLAEKLVSYGIAAVVTKPKPVPPPVIATAEKAAPENTARRIIKPPPRGKGTK